MKRLKYIYGIFSLILFCLAISACRKQVPQEADAIGVDGYVYVPQFRDLLTDDNLIMLTCEVLGDSLYYVQIHISDIKTPHLYRLSLIDDSEPQEVPLSVIGGSNITKLRMDSKGNLLVFSQDFSDDFANNAYVITTYDQNGQFISSLDVSSQINEDSGFHYLNYMEIDGNDNLYFGNETSIFLYDPSGQYHGKIETGTLFDAMKTGKDGRVYIHSVEDNGSKLVTIDYEDKKLDKVYKNLPELYTLGSIATDTQNHFLMNSGSALYSYDTDTQSSKKILKWIDSDVSSDTIMYYWALEDGKIILINQLFDGTHMDIELVKLTKTPISEMPKREVLTAASLFSSSIYQNQAVRFNKISDKYQIVFKSYVLDDAQWTDTTHLDAVEALKKDIISDNPPDILILDGDLLDITTLGKQNLLADLNQFLSIDSELRAEDIAYSVLRTHTVNGQLLALPDRFTIRTLIGKSSIVGDTAGWSYYDFSALMDQYPDRIVFGSTKTNFLSNCLRYGLDYWIDEKTGTSRFNEKSFKDLLLLCNRFPSEYNMAEQMTAPGDAFVEEKVLLENNTVYNVSSYLIQEIRANEPVTFIGYPTPDGSFGSSIETNCVYTIPSGSANKEGAWSFIKFVLQSSDVSDSLYTPVLTSQLETTFANAITPEYELDAIGNPKLDDAGNEIEKAKESYSFWNSESYYLYAVTEDKIAGFRSLIDSAVKSTQADDVLNIILEEAEAYFVGQKTVDEVADIIQRRVQVYVSENN
ncbi:MAG: hypothetical protein LBM60_00385 [Clostridium sp.]|jgi:ABC-type glycerol-3-phosphate transport system substrate-binding protein|nr:hypothetical protein [Clostridium sp.]